MQSGLSRGHYESLLARARAFAVLPPELARNPIEGFSAGLVDDSNGARLCALWQLCSGICFLLLRCYALNADISTVAVDSLAGLRSVRVGDHNNRAA